MMSVYTLTGLTGRRVTNNRVQVFASFEAKARTWRALIAAGIVLVVTSAFAWAFLEAVGIVLGLAFGALAFSALMVRSKQDNARLWIQVRRDRARSDAGRFFVCGNEVDLLRVETLVLSSSTVPGPGTGEGSNDSAARAASPHASPRAPQTPIDRTSW